MTQEEIITEARRKRQAGEFNRRVVSRTPSDIYLDLVTLECGHQSSEMHPPPGREPIQSQSCGQCAYEWIRTRAETT